MEELTKRASQIPNSDRVDFITNLQSTLADGDELADGPRPGHDHPAALREIPGVRHLRTNTDIMQRLNKKLRADDDCRYQLPATRELAAQYLSLCELSLP